MKEAACPLQRGTKQPQYFVYHSPFTIHHYSKILIFGLQVTTMGDIVFCAFYLLLFSFIILQARLFKLPGVNTKLPLITFYLKLVFGAALWYIYTHHYKNRYSADIFKYFDDSKYMYQSIHRDTADFFRMLFGIDDSGPRIQGYYQSMVSWVNGHNSTLYNNSHLIIRLNAVLMPFSQGHYAVHVLFFCFIAFVGLTFLYKAFYPYLAGKATLLFAAIFLFPSVLLWSSGILKESLVFMGLGLSIYYFRRILEPKKTNQLINVLLFVAGISLLFEVKAYVLLCIIPGFISETLISKVKIAASRPWLTYLVVAAVYLGIGLNVNKVNKNEDPLRTLSDKQKEFNRLAKGGIYLQQANNEYQYAYVSADDSVNILPANKFADSLLKYNGIQYLTTSAFCYAEETGKRIAPYTLRNGTKFRLIRSLHEDTLNMVAIADTPVYRLDTYIEPAKSAVYIPPIQPTVTGLITTIPNALLIALIRPYPSEISSKALLIYTAENLFILLLIILSLVFIKRQNPNNPIALFCLSYCMLMLILIGVSTPMYGGIERYKSVVIPFMLILLLLIYDKDKLNRLLKNKK